MGIIGGVLLALLFSAVLGTQMLMFPAMWRGLRDEWRRYPAERRRRGIVGGVLAGVYLVVSAGLGTAEPWGQYTILYVVGLGCGIAMVMTLTAVAVLAVQESRRGRHLRAQRSEAGKHRRDSSNKRGQR